MSPGITIRQLVSADHPAVVAINNEAVPAMNRQNLDSLRWLVEHAVYARVAEHGGVVAAFLIGLEPGTGYDSENYRWFSDRHAEFLYIDRIAVAANARNHGLGSALYDDMAGFALGRWPRLLAEVNLEPPNPRSLSFHERHGFTAIGELEHLAGSHALRVVMMERAV